MKKDISSLLQRGNITPKQRVLLLVADSVSLEKDKKSILTDAEKEALSSGWKPANNEEVREYNRYNQGWKIAGFAELDAQTTFMDTQITYFQEKQASNFLLLYPIFREAKNWAERIKDIKKVNIDQALEITQKQREVKLKDGLDFEYAVYLMAFEISSKPLQEDLKILYDEAEFDTQYLDDEETLSNLFGGEKKLTIDSKNKLADLIIKRAYNDFAKEWQFYHYFGSIPLKEIGKKWLDKRGIKPGALSEEDEDFNKAFAKASELKKLTPEEALKDFTSENLAEIIESYAKSHDTSVEAELKEIVLEWLDNGLLNEYEPLFKSTSTDAYNGNTKLPHKELFKEWIKSKAEAKKRLENLITENKLKRDGNAITGESLYAFNGDYQFTKEFKEKTDHYDANLGILYADDDPEHKGKHLDRELLITDLDKNGKPYGINFSQLAFVHLEGYFETMGFVKETEVNGERIIEFEDDTFNQLLRNSTESLKKHYITLLSFRDLFERLSEIYEVDLTHKINKWVEKAEEFIDSHNSVLKLAVKKSFEEMRSKKIVRLKDDLFIDKTKLKPDQEKIFEFDYFNEFEKTLGQDFKNTNS
jgi:hypothetical protein